MVAAKVMIGGTWRTVTDVYALLNHPGHSSQKSHGRRGGGTPDDLAGDDEAIRATWNFEDPKTGMRATVGDIVHDRFSTEAHITVTDRAGNVVGKAIRTVKPGQSTVHHDSLELQPGVQGQGFATRFNAAAEESYRAHGIEKITLKAGQNVGGYAWARAGYDFADMNARANVVNRARDRAAYDPSSRDQIDAVISRGDFLPIEVAMIGHTAGAEMWLGKEIMMGTNWNAVKELT